MKNLPAFVPGEELLWLWGRDGALTCKTADGQWLLGNSLPRRTAQRMLRDLRVTQSVCCFLDVPHGAFLEVALRQLSRCQALIAVVPDADRLHTLLCCGDFSEAVNSHRLWIVAGEDWAARFGKIFLDYPGLPTPSSFIRTALSDEALIQTLIAQAQEIFAAEGKRRARIISDYANKRSPKTSPARKRICLIAPSSFRLWDPAAQALAEIVQAARFDPDEPSSASPLALAMAAAECDALLAANIGRADANGVVGPDRPWITWVTRPIIPAYAGGERDQLLLADPSWLEAAQRLGWPSNQITVTCWPLLFEPTPPGRYIALIANTMTVTVEPDHFELSSHALLWETIRLRLVKDPFDLQTEPAQYLADFLRRCNVAPDGLDQLAFIEQLIIPTYQQSLARLLMRSGCALRLFGSGWADIAEFAEQTGGCITDFGSMRDAVAGSAALVHAWPVRYAHPIEAMNRPVVHAAGANGATFVHSGRLALQSKLPAPSSAQARISSQLILSRI